MAESYSYPTYVAPEMRRAAQTAQLEQQVRSLQRRLDRERLRNKRLREQLLAEKLTAEEKAILRRAQAEERSRLEMSDLFGLEDSLKYA